MNVSKYDVWFRLSFVYSKSGVKCRTKEKLDQVITFLTGFSQKQIEDPLTKKVRYLDKLVEELTNGKKNRKIFAGTLNLELFFGCL